MKELEDIEDELDDGKAPENSEVALRLEKEKRELAQPHYSIRARREEVEKAEFER